jgi:primosomal protein N''
MNKTELIAFTKATALNKIRRLCHPKTPTQNNEYMFGESLSEQRFYKIKNIIKELEQELTKIKHNKQTKITSTK